MTAGNSLSEYAVLYRCRPYISDYTSGSATSFYLFAGTTSTYAQIPIGSSNSTN